MILSGNAHRNAVPVVKSVFKNALWTVLRTIFPAKCTRLQDFAYTIPKNLKISSRGDIPVLYRIVPVLGLGH